MADLPAPESPFSQTTAAAGLIPTRPEFCRDFAFAPENILALAVVVIADDATMLMQLSGNGWLDPILAYCRVHLGDDYSDHESFCGNPLLQRAPDH